MPTTEDINLRPRFKIEIPENSENVLKRFEKSKSNQKEFIISRIDNHVFIKFPKLQQQFWSPQLHLEIDEMDNNNSILHGVFGPNPTVWTFFMFMHFLVVCVFLIFGIWSYSNYTLNLNYTLQISIMILMLIIWIALYFIGKFGRDISKNDMSKLFYFMNRTLKT